MSTQILLTQALYKKGLALPIMLQLYQKKGDIACLPFAWDSVAVFEEACVLSQIIVLTAYSSQSPWQRQHQQTEDVSLLVLRWNTEFCCVCWIFFSVLMIDVVLTNVTSVPHDIVKRKEESNRQKPSCLQQEKDNSFHLTVKTIL